METLFETMPLSAGLKQVVAELGYRQLTPIQALCIPVLLSGRDVIGQSQTGSGKTAAFAIPILERIDTSARRVQALVICPTRELCQQVAREIRRIGRYRKDLRVVILCGGHPVFLDRRALEHGSQIVVGTPGRLMDHIDRQTISLGQISTLVLDEADKMLDMGFREKIEAILQHTPTNRQTALFSATFPKTIEALSQRYQKTPDRLTAETPEMPEILQLCFKVNREEKTEAIVRVLRARPFESVLVFCNFKIVVDELVSTLRQAGFSADRLHGDLEQHVRDTVMAKFRNHSTRILVATDVAARGIDIVGLDAVINFELPNDPDQYIHRIGRTGRAGAPGLAIALVSDSEVVKLRRIEEAVQHVLVVKALRTLEQELASQPGQKEQAVEKQTLSISGGRKDKLRPGDILGALTGDIGIPGSSVGKIEILERVSFVAIDRALSQNVLMRLRQGKIKGRRFMVQMH